MIDALTLNPESFGLDISDLSLKIIKLQKRKEGVRVVSFGETAIKPGLIEGGEIRNEEELVKILRESLSNIKGKKLRTKYVVASLPEEKAFLQVIQMPKMKEEDLKSAVVYEAENYIPMPLEEVYLDSQIITPFENHLDHYEVLIAAMPRKIIDSYALCFKKAGLFPRALEIESQATARVLIKNETSPAPTLLIDFGETRTSFIVFSGHSLRFTSSIPVSSRIFTQLISKNLGVSLSEAERLKIKYGIEEKFKEGGEKKEIDAEKEGGKIFESLVPPLVDLIQQIKRYLEYYKTHASHEHLGAENKGVSKVLLCGGGANLKGLPHLLSLELKIPVEIGNPWENISQKRGRGTPELSAEDALRYTTAMGLALRGISEND